MTSIEFVDAIRKYVMAAAAPDTISLVERPPGRRPAANLTELSAWYKTLSESDRAMVGRMLELVAHQAVHGVLAVLDGARTIEPNAADDYFELRHGHDGVEDILSGPTGGVLHELL